MGIEAVGHVIAAGTRCCSFKEMGRLQATSAGGSGDRLWALRPR